MLTVLVAFSTAQADTATFGRGQAGDYAPDKWDDVAWRFPVWNLSTYPAFGYMEDGDQAPSRAVTLFGVKDLFPLVPPTSAGDEIVIDSASMDIMTRWNTGVTCNATLNRITTDWLLYAAGTNEDNVNWDDIDVADTNTAALEWATNPDATAGQIINTAPSSWGASDFTTSNEQIQTWTGGWDLHTTWDITDMVADAYAAGENYGWLLSGDGVLLTVATSETGAAEPQLIIVYHYETPTGNATLTVLSGSGGGSYLPASVIGIVADTAPTGQVFNAWTGDTTGINDANADDTFITTQATDATITATYVGDSYSLTVVSGSNSGSYTYQEVVAISADTAPSGMVFFVWMGDVDLLDDQFAVSTNLTMPAAEASVTASYKGASDLSLTVYSGTGSGIYTSGQVIAISADPPITAAKAFFKWSGDTGTVVDANAADTTMTMPPTDTVITALYTDAIQYTIQIRQDPSDQYEYAVFDDVEMSFSQWNHSTDWTGTIMDVAIGDERASGATGLIGIADLFTILPLTSGGNPILIHDAEMTVRTDVSSGINGTVEINRVLTDWLVTTAGSNQSNVNSDASDDANGVEWASDPDETASQDWPSSWGSDDYDANGVSKTWDAGWSITNTFDISQLVKDTFESATNYGFVIRMTAAGDNDGGNGNGITNNVSVMTSESGYPPILEITYSYGEPTQMYTLTVVSGNGDGEHQAGLDIPITGGVAPAGMEFNIWVGDGDNVADIESGNTTIDMPHADTTITATWKAAGVPTDWWPTFNEWCSQFFGAEIEPLAYQMFGDDLEFMTLSDSEWIHASETSAAIAFETNLPAMTYIEYGTTTGYGSTTLIETDRYHYIHLGYLTGLSNNTTYHYRFVAEDERGNIITSGDKTFATATPAGVIYIPGSMGSAPYSLTSGNYYLVTQDIAADHTVFRMTQNNITLDLGGHTVSYNNVANPPTPAAGDANFPYDYTTDADYGVVSYWSPSGCKIVNGTIVQGAGSNAAYGSGTGYSPITILGSSGNEIAGITAQWHSNQAKGFHVNSATNVHHNVLTDRGWELTSRHQGADAITNGTTVHHNLIKRARHRIINGGNEIYNNEMYGDAWYTNAFGIFSKANSTVHDNRIFGGGYMFQALSAQGSGYAGSTVDPNFWAKQNVELYDNFVHLQAVEPYTNRSLEYGPKSAVHGARVMWGADNIVFHDNMIITYARDGGDTRGIWVETESINQNVVFRDNLVKCIFEDDIGTKWGCVALGGYDSDANAFMLFKDNRFISNYCMIRAAESYGYGNYTLWEGNTFVKEGQDRPDYGLVHLGYSSGPTRHHYLFDSTFEGGASYDDVVYAGSAERWFMVGWTLTIETETDANVVIRDLSNAIVYSGAADANGICQVQLHQYKQEEAGKTLYTDHEVTVTTASDTYVETVTVDATKTVHIPSAPAPEYWPGDLNTDEIVNIVDLNMVLIDWSKSDGFTDVRSDANGDGTVDIVDLNTVLIDWSKTGFQP